MIKRIALVVAACALAGNVLAAGSAEAGKAKSVACAACHGTSGVALQGMDSLAGQKKEDLLKKMQDFKSGKKPATLMHQLSAGYSDAQIEQLAAYFAALKK
mgnify:CR=1 FL=1